jgi:hypothetical protein
LIPFTYFLFLALPDAISAAEMVGFGLMSITQKKFPTIRGRRGMTEDRLAALQQHFEEQYGKLELPGSKRKKRKRGQDDAELPERVVVESEKDLENDLERTPKATVIAFTEHEEAIEETPITTHKSFMVIQTLATS